MDKKLSELKNVLDAIKTCTEPISKHTDPKSIDDCWKSAFEFIDNIKHDQDISNRLLMVRAEQLQVEADQQVQQIHNYNHGVSVGIKRIVELIKRHQSNGTNN